MSLTIHGSLSPTLYNHTTRLIAKSRWCGMNRVVVPEGTLVIRRNPYEHMEWFVYLNGAPHGKVREELKHRV